MYLMIIIRLANALKDSINMPIERLDIQYERKYAAYCGYLTLKDNDRVIEFKIFTNGEIIRLSGKECDVNV